MSYHTRMCAPMLLLLLGGCDVASWSARNRCTNDERFSRSVLSCLQEPNCKVVPRDLRILNEWKAACAYISDEQQVTGE